MKRYRLGTPETLVPSYYCKGFHYTETPCAFPESQFSCRQTRRGFVVEFEINPETQIFGGGLQFHGFNHTGRRLALKCNADPRSSCGDTHAPVPFIVTNQGYGLYFDTARNVEFYCGIMKRGGELKAEDYQPSLNTEELYRARELENHAVVSVFIPNCEGVDVYVIEGETITEIVAQYNMLSGGGCSVTEQSLGVLYRVNGAYNDKQALEVARYMRENQIPCDTLGLEPGWQTHAYPCTYIWNPERFPEPAGFINTLHGMGYEINLWEHAYVHPASPIYNKLLPYACDYSVFLGLVPDLSIPESRRIFVEQQKKLTAIGVNGFKADECDGSDNTGGWSFPDHAAFPSGLDGEQYHNLFGVLYAQTMHEALDNRPGLSEIRSMGALAAS